MQGHEVHSSYKGPMRRTQNLKEQSIDLIKGSKEFKEEATNQLDELNEESKQ